MKNKTKKIIPEIPEETKSIILKIPTSIYYPMKDNRDARHRKGESVLLHDEFLELIKIGYEKKKKTILRTS